MCFYCYVNLFLLYVSVSSPCQLALFGYPTELFPCFFLSCKTNARVKPAKTGHGPQSSKIFVFYVLFVLCSSVYCLCVCARACVRVCVCRSVLYCCHRAATQLQLTNISYIIIYLTSYIISYVISYHTISYHFICVAAFF